MIWIICIYLSIGATIAYFLVKTLDGGFNEIMDDEDSLEINEFQRQFMMSDIAGDGAQTRMMIYLIVTPFWLLIIIWGILTQN